MSRVTDSIQWDGAYCSFELYALFDAVPKEYVSFDLRSNGLSKPVTSFQLEDEFDVLGNRALVLYDIVLETMPNSLDMFLKRSSDPVIEKGALGCWFALGAEFSFEFLLTPEVADEIYFLRSKDEIAVALDDAELRSDEWKQCVALFRARMRLNEFRESDS